MLDDKEELPNVVSLTPAQGPSVRPRRARPRKPKELKRPSPARMEPLDYLLKVVNDPSAKDTRRDKLALAALPYCHPRVGDRVGAKALRAKAVARAVNGDDDGDGWGDVLRSRD